MLPASSMIEKCVVESLSASSVISGASFSLGVDLLRSISATSFLAYSLVMRCSGILVKAGLVQSQRGANGGYTLARPAADIRLNEVIRILDEDTVDGFCKTHTGVLDACIHTSECGIRPVIVGLHEIVQNALSEITLAELIGSEEKVDARVHQIQRLQTPLRSMRSAN